MATSQEQRTQGDTGVEQVLVCDAAVVNRAVSSWAAELTGQGINVVSAFSSASAKAVQGIGVALELESVPQPLAAAIQRACQLAYEMGAIEAEQQSSVLQCPSCQQANRRGWAHNLAPDSKLLMSSTHPGGSTSSLPSSTGTLEPLSGGSSCPFHRQLRTSLATSDAPDTPELHDSGSDAAHSFGGSVGSHEPERPTKSSWAFDPLQDKDIAEQLYRKIGGWEVLAAAVQDLYACLTSDPMTADFFKDSNMDVLNKHLTAFLGAAMTGRIMYSPDAIWRMHKRRHHGITTEHVDLMVVHFRKVLENLSVAPDVVNQAIDIVMSMRWVFGCESEEDVKARQGS